MPKITRQKIPTNPKFKNLIGRDFGEYSVIGYAGFGCSRHYFTCLCSCGSVKDVQGNHLVSGAIVSCGCFSKENNKTHGMYKSSEYTAWHSMRQRCLNKKSSEYKNYGGRGISICDRWLKSFDLFLLDMGRKPYESASIDRIDVSGNYEPSNCRWASKAEQARNKRSKNEFLIPGIRKRKTSYMVRITAKGKEKHLGCFDNLFDAYCCRKSAENKYWRLEDD